VPRSTAQRGDYRAFLTLQTRWHDNDRYGHVNNVVYYAYFDTAVNEHLIRAGGLDIDNDPVVAYVVETACRYHAPLAFPEKIDVGLRIDRLGRSSVSYDIGIFSERAEFAAATGRFVHVWVERASGRPVAVPERIRHALLPLVSHKRA